MMSRVVKKKFKRLTMAQRPRHLALGLIMMPRGVRIKASSRQFLQAPLRDFYIQIPHQIMKTRAHQTVAMIRRMMLRRAQYKVKARRAKKSMKRKSSYQSQNRQQN